MIHPNTKRRILFFLLVAVLLSGLVPIFSLSQSTQASASVVTVTSSCGSGWGPTLASPWLARIRHGGAGGWRAILTDDLTFSNGTKLNTGGTVPWPNGGTMHLSLAYNSSTGLATMTVTGALPPYDPVVMTYSMPGANGRLLITGKTSQEDVGRVLVSNVTLNGAPVGPCGGFTAQGSALARDIQYLVIDGVSGDFTVACDVTFYWGSSPSGEGPALDIQVENAIPPTVITKAVSSVTTNSAILQGNLAALGTDTSVLVSFEWATEAYYTSNGNTYLHETTPETVSLPVSLPRAFSFDLSGLSPGTTYHYRAKAVGSEAYGNDMSLTTGGGGSGSGGGGSGGSGGGGGGGCFIATAAYGSSLDSHLDTLRSFRDQYLETNPLGSAFVSLYYKVSPPMAAFIEKHPTLKPIVRAELMPAVAMSSVALNTTLAEKAVILVAMALFTTVLIMWLRRRTRRLERR
jgi:hypothetical protein